MKTRVCVAWGVAAAMVAASCGPTGDNTAPELDLSPGGPEALYKIGEEVLITAFGNDEDGDALTFDWTVRTDNPLSTIEDTATFITTAQSATFRWTPDSADITAGDPLRLIFITTDARGARTEREKKITITPGNGEPVFDSSANQLYKECCDKPLVFDVVVIDPDAADVTLTMSEEPSGARFEQIGAFKGRFTWTPEGSDGDQRIHSVKFTVNDGQNPPVDQLVTIVIPPDDLGGGGGRPTDPEADVCVGERLIEHNPLGSQREPKPEFTINAALKSGTERYDKYIMFWSDRDPTFDTDATVFSTDMVRDGNTISGAIPNVAAREGKDQTIAYKICLFDSLASDEDPDALVCNPSVNELFHNFKAYADAGSGCLEDPLDKSSRPNDTRQTASPMSETAWEPFTACGGNQDFHSKPVRPGQSFALVVSYPFGAQLDLELLDVIGTPIPSSFDVSDCSGLAIAEVELSADASASEFYVKVSGDDVPYHVTAIELASGAGCQDEDLEPNPDASRASELRTGTTTELEICPDGSDSDVYAIDLDHGEALTVTMTHPSSQANLDMTLYSPYQADFPDLNGVKFTFGIGQDEEVLEYEARHCGTHYLKVFSNGAAASYELDVQKTAGSCTDDDTRSASDCNHGLEDASLFPWNQTVEGLKLCSKGDDWYRHRGNAAYILGQVTVTSGDPAGLEFEIYDIDGQKLADGDPDSTGASIEYTFTTDDMYYFRVSSPNTIEYELEVLQ